MQYAGFPFIRVGITDEESHGDVVIKHLSMNQLGLIGMMKERKYSLFANLSSSVQHTLFFVLFNSGVYLTSYEKCLLL
jgi:hypothetical protein